MIGARPSTRGQATVELALTLPFVAIVLVVIVQLGLLVRAQLLVDQAAWQGARAALAASESGSASGQPIASAPGAAARQAARDVLPGITAVTELTASNVRVHTVLRFHPDMPIVGRFMPVIVLHGDASMVREPGPRP